MNVHATLMNAAVTQSINEKDTLCPGVRGKEKQQRHFTFTFFPSTTLILIIC